MEPRVPQAGICIRSVLWISCQHLSYQSPDILTELIELFGKDQLSFPNVFDSFTMVLRFEGSFAADQPIKDNSSSPNIDRFPIASLEHLGGPIEQSSSDGPHFEVRSSFLEPLRNAEIYDFDLLCQWVIENVLWFDVPVHDISRM